MTNQLTHIATASACRVLHHVGTCSLCYGDVCVELYAEIGSTPTCSKCGAVAKYKMPLMIMELKKGNE